MAKTARPPGPERRTNKERNAETRGKLIAAAIHCLRTHGYAATSVGLVAETAQLSRGAILHHFGSKVDLMLAVAEQVVKDQNAFMKARVERYAPGRDRFIGLTEATWESVNQPGPQAFLEIMMASRSDGELGERFPAVAAALAETQRRGAWSLAQLAGIADREAVDAMSQLHRAAMEGLSMRGLALDGVATEPMLKLLMEYKIAMTDRLIAEARDGLAPPSRQRKGAIA